MRRARLVLGINHIHFDILASTQDEARAQLLKGTAAPFFITADVQTSGRGRMGRIWHSPRGNFYGSLVLSLPAKPHHYAFVTALALRDAMAGQVQRAVTCKWPNDILLEGKKCAGILIEVDGGHIIIGMGVNMYHAPPSGLAAYPATALFVGDPPDDACQNFVSKVTPSFTHWQMIYDQHGFAAIRDAWHQHAHHLGQEIAVQVGDETIRGQCLGIDADGAMRLMVGDRERFITAADVLVPA